MFREALNLFLRIRGLDPLYLRKYTVEDFYRELHELLTEKFDILERHVIKYTFVVQGSNQCKELVRTALEKSPFFALAGTDRVALLTDAEAAAFSVAKEKTRQIKVISLCNGVVTNLTASKQEVKVESEEEKVDFDFTAQLTKVKPEGFNLRQFKKELQPFPASDINDLDATVYPGDATVSLKPIQEFIYNAFENIKKEPNDTKLVILNNFGLFDKVMKKLICNMSKANATQATDASKKVEMARNEQRRLQVRIHEMEDSFNVLQIKRDKLKLGADKNKVVQQAFEAADEELKLAQDKVKLVKEELEAAKKDCVKAEDEEYNTWVKHVSEIDANGLINGAKVSTKPLIIVTPIYDDIKKTGLYETTAVNYTKIVAIGKESNN
ncbi:hypothetical protein [Parasitella parasitica]|uniref:Uncharacterized protein n=1 Tax=Parasitella parasitica TaxID=35722 RepID=A0A0B7N1S9_9FUNG|nr:hypothetical protein [Parasitella parasitica]